MAGNEVTGSSWTKGKDMARSRRIKLIAGAIVVISVVHYLYLFPMRMSVTRELVSRAYFFPIILAALWFGLRGGVLMPVIVSLICLPYTIIAMEQHRVFFMMRFSNCSCSFSSVPLWESCPITEETAASVGSEKTEIQAIHKVASSQVRVGDERESLCGDIEKPMPIF